MMHQERSRRIVAGGANRGPNSRSAWRMFQPLHEPAFALPGYGAASPPSAGAPSAAPRGGGGLRLAQAKSEPGEVEPSAVHGPDSRANLQVATFHEPRQGLTPALAL